MILVNDGIPAAVFCNVFVLLPSISNIVDCMSSSCTFKAKEKSWIKNAALEVVLVQNKLLSIS